MNHDIAPTAHGLPPMPTGGLVMMVAGAAIWIGSTAVKVLGASPGAVAPVMAVADPAVTVTITSVDWASVGQVLSGVLFAMSLVFSWVMGKRKQIDDYRRDKKLQDALTDIQIAVEANRAHSDHRFEKQDVVLKTIADTQAASPPSPTPISISVSPANQPPTPR